MVDCVAVMLVGAEAVVAVLVETDWLIALPSIVTLGVVVVPKELLAVDRICTVWLFDTVPEDTKLPPAILTVQPLVVTLTDEEGMPPTVIEFEVTVALGSCSVAFVKSLGLNVMLSDVVTVKVCVCVPTVILQVVVFPADPVAFSEKVIVVPFCPLLALTDPFPEAETDAVSPVPSPAIVYCAVPAEPLAALAAKLPNPEGVISTAAETCT